MTCWWRNKEVHTINQRRACKPIKYWGIYTHIHTRYKKHASAHECITSGSVTMPTYGRTGESSCTWINYVNKQAIKSRAAKYQASDRLLPQHGSKPNQETSRPSQIASKPRPTTQPRSPSTRKQFKRKEHTTSANNSDTISNYDDQLLGWTAHRSTTQLRWSTTLPWTKLSDTLIFYIPDIIHMPLWPYHLPLTAINFLA